eukprot:PITA_26136
MEAPNLISLDNTKGFCIFSFSSYDTLAAVLLQTNDEGIEHPVAFFSKTLRDDELRFGCPTKLVTDNATNFKAKELVDMIESMGIQVVHSTSYYPQGNGLAESSNKSLVRVIKKLLEENKKRWDSKLKFAIWADRVTIKKSIGNSPFKLVYGADVVFTIQLILPVAKFLQE